MKWMSGDTKRQRDRAPPEPLVERLAELVPRDASESRLRPLPKSELPTLFRSQSERPLPWLPPLPWPLPRDGAACPLPLDEPREPREPRLELRSFFRAFVGSRTSTSARRGGLAPRRSHSASAMGSGGGAGWNSS